jgi:DNA polymerase elongation subunit (family B)
LRLLAFTPTLLFSCPSPARHPSRHQTDSVFIHFPSASPAEAIGLGHAAAAAVTAGLTAPMELKFEKVAAPFLLLHVNR